MKKICIATILLMVFCSISFADVEETITKTMAIKPVEGELSALTFVNGNKAFITVYSQLSATDEVAIWKDLQILKDMPEVTEIVVYLNSMGGGAGTGFAIGQQFKRVEDRFKLSIHASDTVASAALMVFLAFEKRYVAPYTMFMVHEIRRGPDTTGMDRSQVKVLDDLFDKYSAMYVDVLVKNSTVDKGKWEEMMKETTWFSATQAHDWGLVTEVK